MNNAFLAASFKLDTLTEEEKRYNSIISDNKEINIYRLAMNEMLISDRNTLLDLGYRDKSLEGLYLFIDKRKVVRLLPYKSSAALYHVAYGRYEKCPNPIF